MQRRATLSALCIGVLAAASVSAMSPPSWMVFFVSDSTQWISNGDDTLRQFAATYKMINRDDRVSVVAHTDGAEASMALAQARGDVVKNRLVELGIPADRIVVWPRAEQSPLVRVPLGTAEPQNRRVEIVQSS